MNDEPPAFAAPWEAQIFALVTCLQDAGLFTASDWSRALGAAIRPDGAAQEPATYTHWLAALEHVLAARGIVDAATVAARSAAFLRAAVATPHGAPVLLANDPQSGLSTRRPDSARSS